MSSENSKNTELYETWKDIPGYENLYQASNLGRVRSLDRITEWENRDVKGFYKGKILSGGYTKKGYLEVHVYKNGKGKKLKKHRMIAKAFIPNPKKLPQINHKNGVKDDNRVENLEWTDNSGNQLHAFEYGLNTPNKGEDNGSAKLTWKEVKEIRSKYKTGKYTQKELSIDYNTSVSNISMVVTYATWLEDDAHV